ncbi:hypothetical protein HZS_7806 [Henneguya salminicola]|nr:hypothetical protein HZS_7806 [Henneguya salminicola]
MHSLYWNKSKRTNGQFCSYNTIEPYVNHCNYLDEFFIAGKQSHISTLILGTKLKENDVFVYAIIDKDFPDVSHLNIFRQNIIYRSMKK